MSTRPKLGGSAAVFLQIGFCDSFESTAVIPCHQPKTVRSSGPDKGRALARQNDPEFGELTGLRIDLYRTAMLFDDDVVTDDS